MRDQVRQQHLLLLARREDNETEQRNEHLSLIRTQEVYLARKAGAWFDR